MHFMQGGEVPSGDRPDSRVLLSVLLTRELSARNRGQQQCPMFCVSGRHIPVRLRFPWPLLVLSKRHIRTRTWRPQLGDLFGMSGWFIPIKYWCFIRHSLHCMCCRYVPAESGCCQLCNMSNVWPRDVPAEPGCYDQCSMHSLHDRHFPDRFRNANYGHMW